MRQVFACTVLLGLALGREVVAAPAGGRTADPAMAPLDQRIAAQAAHIKRQGEQPSPTDLEVLAQLHLERAGLSGDYDDLANAEAALDEAVRRSPPGTGPLLARAQFNYKVHRLARAEADLAAVDKWVIKRPEDVAAIASLRNDIAFHAGKYALARKGYEKGLNRRRSPRQAVALAQLEWKTGHFDKAAALFEKAKTWALGEATDLRAWVFLSQGIMELDRGRFAAAVAAFDQGLGLRPGFWTLEEHRAEALAALGKDDEALRVYLDLVARIRDPEFMDAAAALLAKRGETEAAARLVADARAAYEKRIKRFPEATAGHALEFFLRHDPGAAIPLAELNARARPGGEAQVLLARVYFASGRIADAKRVVTAVLPTGWDTADLHAIAAEIFAATGDPRAAKARKRALALNRHVLDDSETRAPQRHGG